MVTEIKISFLSMLTCQVCKWLTTASQDSYDMSYPISKILSNKSEIVDFLRISVTDIINGHNRDVGSSINNSQFTNIPALGRLLVLIGDCYTLQANTNSKEGENNVVMLPWQIILESAISTISCLKKSTYVSQEKLQNAMMLIYNILSEMNRKLRHRILK